MSANVFVKHWFISVLLNFWHSVCPLFSKVHVNFLSHILPTMHSSVVGFYLYKLTRVPMFPRNVDSFRSRWLTGTRYVLFLAKLMSIFFFHILPRIHSSVVGFNLQVLTRVPIFSRNVDWFLFCQISDSHYVLFLAKVVSIFLFHIFLLCFVTHNCHTKF